MHGAIVWGMDAINGNLFGSLMAMNMDPACRQPDLLSHRVDGDSRSGTADFHEMSHRMINLLVQAPEETSHVDIGGKDTRPGDLATHFDPKMDQGIHLYTGGGDDMVIIV
jgi:hypothetical protein